MRGREAIPKLPEQAENNIGIRPGVGHDFDTLKSWVPLTRHCFRDELLGTFEREKRVYSPDLQRPTNGDFLRPARSPFREPTL